MADRNNGGPAYPVEVEGDPLSGVGVQTGPASGWHTGMTLRDWFAGQAMAAALTTASATSEEYLPDLFKYVATQAYAQADAMLAERAK